MARAPLLEYGNNLPPVPSFIRFGAPLFNYLEPVFTGFISYRGTFWDFHAAAFSRVIAGVARLRSILFTAVINSASSAAE